MMDTESISVPTDPTAAKPYDRFSPIRPSIVYRDRETFDTLTQQSAPSVTQIVDGVSVFVSWEPWEDIALSQDFLDPNLFMTIDNDIGGNTALHGIKLNRLGVYWVNGTVAKSVNFSDSRISYMECLLVGPPIEDQASYSAGGASDTLYFHGGDEQTTLTFQGYAMVTDLTADNHLYLTVMMRLNTALSGVSVNMEVTYMGTLDAFDRNK